MNPRSIGPMPRFRLYSSTGQYVEVVKNLLLGRLHWGQDCARLERTFEARYDVPNALCMPKARVAIHMAIKAYVKPGKSVILSPYTISDVINMVIAAGAIPVFADLVGNTCNIGIETISPLVDENTGAVMVTHLHGLACDMAPIEALCRDRGLALIEDAAQALGAKDNNRPVGTIGDAGIFSFGMYKNINSFFGGLLICDDNNIAESIRRQRDLFPWQETPYYLRKVIGGLITDVATWPPIFRTITYRIFQFGYLKNIALLNQQVTIDAAPEQKRHLADSYFRRMTPLQARLVLKQLDGLTKQIEKRIAHAALYRGGLSDIDELGLPPYRTNHGHTYRYFPILAPNRDDLLRYLMQRGRDIGAQHLKNCADLACFKEFARDCPNARRTAASVVLLPTYPSYGADEVEKTVACIRAYFGV